MATEQQTVTVLEMSLFLQISTAIFIENFVYIFYIVYIFSVESERFAALFEAQRKESVRVVSL